MRVTKRIVILGATVVGAASATAPGQLPAVPTPDTVEWRFNEPGIEPEQEFVRSSGGSSLTPTGFVNGLFASGTTGDGVVPDIDGQATGYVRLTDSYGANEGLECYYLAPGNGGGGCCNVFHFTIVMDVYVLSTQTTGYQCLWQGNDSNSNDGEFFMNLDTGGFWLQGTGAVDPPSGRWWEFDTWHRIAHRVDWAGNVSDIFVDGVKVAENVSAPDWLWAANTGNRIWMVSDDGGVTDVADVALANIAIVDALTSDPDIAALGGPDAEGIFDGATSPATGACYMGDCTCTDVVAADCSTSGGWVVGQGTTCADTDCPFLLNDDCADATAVGLGDFDVSTTGATTDGPALACGVSIFNDVWYAFTAPDNGDYTVTTCNQAAFDTVIAVYAGLDCGVAGNVIACSDDAPGCGTSSEVTFAATSGTAYLIQLGGPADGVTGSAMLTVDGPPGGRPAVPTADTVEWRFDDIGVQQDEPFEVAAGSSILTPTGFVNGTWQMGVTGDGTIPDIDDASTGYVRLTESYGEGEGLRCYLLQPGNGSGGCCNVYQFTMVWDIYVLSTQTTGFQAMWQGSDGNTNDAEFFLNLDTGGFWLPGPGNINPPVGRWWEFDSWHRIVHRVDFDADVSDIYVDGIKVVAGTTAPDWLWAANTGLSIWMVSDNGGANDVADVALANIAIIDGLMSDAGIATLGGAGSGGIFDETTSPPTGACYQPADCACSDVPSADCYTSGGWLEGLGTSCAGTVCPFPPNDNCQNPIAIDLGSYDYDTVFATTSDLTLTCPFGTAGVNDQIYRDVWFTFIAPEAGEYVVSTCNQADYDSTIAVHLSIVGLCGLSGFEIGCNDDAEGCGATSALTFTATAGTEYLIQVGGFDEQSVGTGTLTVGVPGSCPADFDGNGEVDVNDLLTLLGAWGPNPGGDTDGDGDTDVDDLLNLLGAWGPCV